MIKELSLILGTLLILTSCSKVNRTYTGQDVKLSGDVNWSGARLWDYHKLKHSPRLPIALIFKEGENINIPYPLKTSNLNDWDDETNLPILPPGQCKKSYFLYVLAPEESFYRRIHATGTITFTDPISAVIEGENAIRDTQPIFYPEAKTRKKDYTGWWINLEGRQFKESFARDYITIKGNTLTFDISVLRGLDGVRIIIGCSPK